MQQKKDVAPVTKPAQVVDKKQEQKPPVLASAPVTSPIVASKPPPTSAQSAKPSPVAQA